MADRVQEILSWYSSDNVGDTLKGRNTMSTNVVEGRKDVEIIERIYRKRDEQLV